MRYVSSYWIGSVAGFHSPLFSRIANLSAVEKKTVLCQIQPKLHGWVKGVTKRRCCRVYRRRPIEVIKREVNVLHVGHEVVNNTSLEVVVAQIAEKNRGKMFSTHIKHNENFSCFLKQLTSRGGMEAGQEMQELHHSRNCCLDFWSEKWKHWK